MILPVGASSFKESMKMGCEVYHHLKVILESHITFIILQQMQQHTYCQEKKFICCALLEAIERDLSNVFV